MFLLGTLFCGVAAISQGDTAWEPWDRGWFAAWVVQYFVVGGLLVYLWWRRSRAWAIIVAPVAILVLELSVEAALVWIGIGDSEGDSSDSSTFADAFLPLVLGVSLATAVVGYVALLVMRSARGDTPPSAPAG
jgi:hypothetical protein